MGSLWRWAFLLPVALGAGMLRYSRACCVHIVVSVHRVVAAIARLALCRDIRLIRHAHTARGVEPA